MELATLSNANEIRNLSYNSIVKRIKKSASKGYTQLIISKEQYEMYKKRFYFEDNGYKIRNIMNCGDNYIEISWKDNEKSDKSESESNNNKPELKLLYSDHKNKCLEFIKNNNLEELSKYKDFDLLYIVEFLKPNDETMKYIIDNCKDLEKECPTSFRPIHYICLKYNFEIVKYIIEKGVKLDCKNKNDSQPIHFLCQNRNLTIEMLKYMISYKGVNHNCTGKWGTPFLQLCQNKNLTLEMLKYFIEMDNNISCKCKTIYTNSEQLCIIKLLNNKNFTIDMFKYILSVKKLDELFKYTNTKDKKFEIVSKMLNLIIDDILERYEADKEKNQISSGEINTISNIIEMQIKRD